MKRISFILFVFLASLAVSITAFGQFPEDALRYSTPGLGIGARSLGMGTAYTGVANDFSAAFWNPAGLGQMRLSEVTLGLSNLSYGNTSTFFSNNRSLTNSATSLNSFGLVYPFPTARGSLVFAIGFGRQVDFTTGLSFQGLNPQSSIIQTWAPDGQLTNDPRGNIAYELYLANADSIGPNSYRWDSKILNRITQSGKVLEGGGQNYLTVSSAVEAAKNFYIGATLNFITGSYTYTRNYYEDDLNNLYATKPFDFQSLSLTQTVESDLSGFTMKLGMLYKFAPGSRLGIAVKTPSWITVHETFSDLASSTFDNGDNFIYPSGDNVPQKNEYDITSPFVFSAGISHTIGDFMLAGDIEYTDWTQMEFSNTTLNLLSLNTTIKEEFRPTVNLRAGGEYEFPASGFRIRAGYAFLPSPYRGDPSSFAQKYITGGLGFIVEDAFAIDFGYAHGSWKTYHVNYNASSRTDEDISTNNLIGTVSYRF